MPPKRRRPPLRARVGANAPLPEWRETEEAEMLDARRRAGARHLHHLLGLYAKCHLSAKDLCIAMHDCAEAGVLGGNLRQYALPPGKDSGAYQHHLDRVLPQPVHVYSLAIPGTHRRRALRVTRTVAARCFWETLSEEYLEAPFT